MSNLLKSCVFSGWFVQKGVFRRWVLEGSRPLDKPSIGKQANHPLQNWCFLPKRTIFGNSTFPHRLWVKLKKIRILKIHFRFVLKIRSCEQRHRCFDPACMPLNHVWPGPEVVCLRSIRDLNFNILGLPDYGPSYTLSFWS